MNYYNEHDPKAAAWLRELIAQGHIPAGHVDQRSIVLVHPDDLAGYAQCHFFAGIGGWSLALRLAGWQATAPVWTMSCPCQPFSTAGKGHGEADPRHLWPEGRRLIRDCRPAIVFGEQVAGAPGRRWFAGVRADLAALGYPCIGADLCAAGAGAPHIRQRLYWMAHALEQRQQRPAARPAAPGRRQPAGGGTAGTVAHSAGVPGAQHEHQSRRGSRRPAAAPHAAECGGAGGLDHTLSHGRRAHGHDHPGHDGQQPVPAVQPQRLGHTQGHDQRRPRLARESDGRPVTTGGPGAGSHSPLGHPDQLGCEGMRRPEPAQPHIANHWQAFDLLPCLDGKTRRVEPGTFPLAHGFPHRVGLLRGYGNAIVPQIAAAFIQACQDVISQAA
jgi:DNA (cytosine-5)-methyltransferase 1